MTATTKEVPSTLVKPVDLQLLTKQLDDPTEAACTHAAAERYIPLGVIPGGRSPDVASASPLDLVGAAPCGDLVVVKVDVQTLDLGARHLTDHVPVTHDVLVEASRDAVQQRFPLRAHRARSALPIGR